MPSAEEGLSDLNELKFVYPREFKAIPKPNLSSENIMQDPQLNHYVVIDDRSVLYKLIPKKLVTKRKDHKGTAYLAFLEFCKQQKKSFTCKQFVKYLKSMCSVYLYYLKWIKNDKYVYEFVI